LNIAIGLSFSSVTLICQKSQKVIDEWSNTINFILKMEEFDAFFFETSLKHLVVKSASMKMYKIFYIEDAKSTDHKRYFLVYSTILAFLLFI